MRYFRITYYLGEEDFEKHSVLIDEPKFRAYQKAMLEDATHLMLENRTIKMSSITNVEPADDEVAEFRDGGVPLSRLGLPELPKLDNGVERLDGEANGFGGFVSHEEFTERLRQKIAGKKEEES